jgi:hypothetical protein
MFDVSMEVPGIIRRPDELILSDAARDLSGFSPAGTTTE